MAYMVMAYIVMDVSHAGVSDSHTPLADTCVLSVVFRS